MSRQVRNLLLYIVVAIGATILGWSFAKGSIGTQLELRLYDYRFRLKKLFPDPPPAPITILAIDEASLRGIPEPMMLWDRHFAEILNYLVEGQASVVGIDFAFSAIEQWDPAGQRALAEALINAASRLPVVLAYTARLQGPPEFPDTIRMAATAVGHTFGYANLTTDPDDFIRRQAILQIDDEKTMQPSLALAVARAFATQTNQSNKLASATESIVINYRRNGTFPRVSFYDAVAAAKRKDVGFFREKFQGRIVLIARIGERGGEDFHSTPLYYSPESASDSLRTPGVEIHANTIATLLNDDAITEISSSDELMITALAAFVIAMIWGYGRLRLAAFLTLIALIGFVLVVLAAFVQARWVWAVPPISSGALALTFALGTNYFLEGKEKRKTRNLFRRYVSDAVISELMERPEDVVLSGEMRNIAVMFADIRGFTTISEKMGPEQVVDMLNKYFGVIVEVIQSHGGTVNCLMGDGLMAIFGAPIKDERAALHAVEAARDMMRSLKRVNEALRERGIQIRIGIGINFGEAVIGSMGSPRKMEYTATGDVVNTAARIESETKKVGCDILVSHAVCKQLPDGMAEFAEIVALGGKNELVALDWVPWKDTVPTPEASGENADDRYHTASRAL